MAKRLHRSGNINVKKASADFDRKYAKLAFRMHRKLINFQSSYCRCNIKNPVPYSALEKMVCHGFGSGRPRQPCTPPPFHLWVSGRVTSDSFRAFLAAEYHGGTSLPEVVDRQDFSKDFVPAGKSGIMKTEPKIEDADETESESEPGESPSCLHPNIGLHPNPNIGLVLKFKSNVKTEPKAEDTNDDHDVIANCICFGGA